jgi:uncharacterized iron-regulated protein
MKRVLLVFAALLGVLTPAKLRAQDACARADSAKAIEEAWQAESRSHPLAGAVLEGAAPLAPALDGSCTRSPIERLQRALVAHMQAGGIVLLGEVHDNGAQHTLRGSLIGAVATELAEAGKPRPALIFEHIRTDQAEALRTTRTSDADGARSLLAALEWEKGGWPASRLFVPIFEAALTHALPILPGHPTRAEVRDVARRGLTALPDDTVSRLGLDVPLPEALQSSLLDELEASHCGLMPRSAFTNMALAQRYRDAHLSAALAEAARVHGSAILLAGNGHVRKDRGVPRDLARMAPERKVLAIMLLEVEAGARNAPTYVERDPEGKPVADYTILTPRTDRPDPCDAMRAHFKKKKE